MFERFAPQAKHAMHLAQAEADRLRHSWLGTEHLLLGMLRQPTGAATQVLIELGVDAESVERQLIEELGGAGDDRPLGDEDERALQTIGIDLREVRRRVEEAFGPGALDQGGARKPRSNPTAADL